MVDVFGDAIDREECGGNKVDEAFPKITGIQVAPDNKSVRPTLDKLPQGNIHELHLDGLRKGSGEPLLHSVAYYTLNEIPVK